MLIMKRTIGTVVLILFFTSKVRALGCYENICHECPESAKTQVGNPVDCTLRRLISEHSYDRTPVLTNYPQERDADFACLKMTASDPRSMSDTTVVIKGCTLKVAANVMCDILSSIAMARGKDNAKCVYCYGDYCNGISNLQSANVLLLIPFLIMLHRFI